MNIGVNTRLLLKDKLEGIGRFTAESLARICNSHPEHTFFFFFDRAYDASFVFAENVIPIVVSPQARHPILWKIWFDWSLPRLFKKHQIDIFFSPEGYLSKRTSIPQVNVIHDLNFVHQPKDVPGWAGRYLRTEFPLFAKKAKHILTVSNYSKQDLAKTYKLDPAKIAICYNGVGDHFSPKSEEIKQNLRSKYTDGHTYILYLGAIHPRKNITRMLQAFEKFKTQNQSSLKFLIAGKKMWWTDEMEAQLKTMNFASDVIFTGHVPQTELPEIYSAAECLVYISYFEGFGIPMIESMKSGTPVLASSTSCLPEIAENAALFVDPYSVDDISKKLHIILTDKGISQSLVEKGLQRASYFTWDRTAEIIWDTIENTYARSL